MNGYSIVFYCVIVELSFQDHLPSKTIIYILNELWLLVDLTVNAHTCFPSVTDEWPFQDHFSSMTLKTHITLYTRKPEWTCRDFLSVTNEWPFQDYVTSKTILSTHSALSPATPEKKRINEWINQSIYVIGNKSANTCSCCGYVNELKRQQFN